MSSEASSSIRYDVAQIVFGENRVGPFRNVVQQRAKPRQRRGLGRRKIPTRTVLVAGRSGFRALVTLDRREDWIRDSLERYRGDRQRNAHAE
jgi:hypothetical protein